MEISERDIATILIKFRIPMIRKYVNSYSDPVDQYTRSMLLENYFLEHPRFKALLDKSKFNAQMILELI